MGRELALRGLDEEELTEVVGAVPPDAARALWVASRGLPGVAKALAAKLDDDVDPIVRLAYELLGDASARPRRQALADEALELARSTSDKRVLAEVLDARLHALWDPQTVHDRLDIGLEIVELARSAADETLERKGLFWRFVALMELGRVAEAESVLAGAGDDMTMATARHAILAELRQASGLGGRPRLPWRGTLGRRWSPRPGAVAGFPARRSTM